MIKKKVELTVHQRRSVTTFFNKVAEVFARKFDGFPAIVLDQSATPGVQTGAEEYSDYTISQDAIDEIAQEFIQENVPPCPDIESIEDCSEISIIETFATVKKQSESWKVSHGPSYPGGSISSTQPGFSRQSPQVLYSVVNSTTGSFMVREDTYIAYELDILSDDNISRAVAMSWVPGLTISSYSNAPAISVGIYSTDWDVTGPSDVGYSSGSSDEDLLWSYTIPAQGASVVPVDIDENAFPVVSHNGKVKLRLGITSGGGDIPFTPGIGNWGVSISNQVPFQFIYNVSVDCSGETFLENLTEVDTGEYAPSLTVENYTDVWVDNIVAVRNVDWTQCGNNLCFDDIDPFAVVTARYIIE